jgi:hypothetical protein
MRTQNIQFNCGGPMYTPNIKTGEIPKITPAERAMAIADVELHKRCRDLKAADRHPFSFSLTSMLMKFEEAVLGMDIELQMFIEKKGASDKTEKALKRNESFMKVCKEFKAQIERNKQLTADHIGLIKNLLDVTAENNLLTKKVEQLEALIEYTNK